MSPKDNLCSELHQTLSQLQRFTFPFDPNNIPHNGIYVLYEQGEIGHGEDRIVRVGTHTGKNQLRSRLQQHFIKENKDRSIFRKNIGRALLHRDSDPFLEQWEIDLTTRKAKERYAAAIDMGKQQSIERRVTEYIQGSFSFVVLPVSEKDRRLALESKIISTVSWCAECRPSAKWLGLYSPKRKIHESGLWLVNQLYKEPLAENDFKQLCKIAL